MLSYLFKFITVKIKHQRLSKLLRNSFTEKQEYFATSQKTLRQMHCFFAFVEYYIVESINKGNKITSKGTVTSLAVGSVESIKKIRKCLTILI